MLSPTSEPVGAVPILEAVLNGDTARISWPLLVAVLPRHLRPVVVVNDDPAGTGETDGVLAGRPAPYGTYHWFFPNGTRAVVSGRRENQVRLQLSERTAAWVAAVDLRALAPGTPPPVGVSQAMRLRAGEGSVTLRVPLPAQVPFRVDEDGHRLVLTVYGGLKKTDPKTKRPLALDGGIEALVREDPGMVIALGAFLEKAQADAIEAAILDEIKKLGAGGPGADELRKAKNQVQAVFVFSLEQAQGLAEAMVRSWILTGDPSSFMRDVEEIEKVPAADVKRVVKQYFAADKATSSSLRRGASDHEALDHVAATPHRGRVWAQAHARTRTDAARR